MLFIFSNNILIKNYTKRLLFTTLYNFYKTFKGIYYYKLPAYIKQIKMGIRGLTSTFKSHTKLLSHGMYNSYNGIHNTNLESISIRHYTRYPEAPLLIGVDFMETAHHWLGSNDTQFIVNFAKFMRIMRKNGAFPIFCFDGKPAGEKQQVIVNRKAKRQLYNVKLNELRMRKTHLTLLNGFMEDATAAIREIDRKINHAIYRSRTITPYHCILIQTILDKMGLQYFYIPDIEGGEMICAHLQRLCHVKYCITNDLDVFPMGATWVIREFNFRTGDCQLYDQKTIMQNIGITSPRQFIDMCILHGCDFLERPIGLTNEDILYLIKKYKTIENIKKHITDVSIDMDDNSDDNSDDDNSSLDEIIFPENYDPSFSRSVFLAPILDEVQAWKPPSINYYKLIMHKKNTMDSKSRIINEIYEQYPELNNFEVSYMLISMLSTQCKYVRISNNSDILTMSDSDDGWFNSDHTISLSCTS